MRHCLARMPRFGRAPETAARRSLAVLCKAVAVSEEESPWQRAYDASIAAEEVRSADAIESADPAWRWSMEFRARFLLAVALFGFVAVGIGLLVRGPWYLSLIGAMLLSGAVLAAIGSISGRVWRMR